MAQFTSAAAINLSTTNFFSSFNKISAGTITVLPGGFRLTVSGSEYLDVLGAFTYSAGAPAVGNITSVERFVSAASVNKIEGISVPLSLAIAFSGNPTASMLPAGLFSGNDTITGSAFDDTLAGYGGKDTIDGAGGNDTVLYTEKNTAVVVTLNGATDATVTVGGLVEDTIRNFENVTGGSQNDTLSGDGNANILNGGNGNDILKGAGGVDTLNGGAGVDTADFSDQTLAVSLTLNGATVATSKIGGVNDDTVVNIENIKGGSAADILTGDAQVNFLEGNAGNDILTGLAGKDVIDGGADSDTAIYSEKTGSVVVTLNGATDVTVTVGGLVEDTLRNVENITGGSAADTITGDSLANTFDGGLGDDILAGLGGSDVLDGNGGIDTASYAEKASAVVVTLNGATNASVTVGGVAEDTLRNVENVTGGSAADTITGDTLANILSGQGGNDTLDGGVGVDTASYAEKTTAVVVTLNGATNASVTVGGVAEDTIRNIENVIGGTGNDTLSGDSLANALTGGNGDDTLNGFGGLDVLDGGIGSDTASFSDKTLSVVVTLNGANNVVAKVGGVNDDTMRNIENLVGGTGDDTLGGDALVNTFDGGNGNDRITGGAGNDIIDGGAGSDTAVYSDQALGLSVTLNGATDATVTVGGVAQDTIRNIENIVGGNANDVIIGDGLANTLEGGNGNDLIRGAGGADTIDGGGGIDTAYYDTATQSVVVTLTGTTFATVKVNGVNEDTVRNVERLFGGSAADTFTGDSFDNLFRGGAGIDVLDGAVGNDTVDFGDKTQSVVLTLNGATIATSKVNGVAEDTVRNIESVIGGSADDTITGDIFANTLSGGLGADTLVGSFGDDILIGGGGNDVLDGGSNVDTANYADKTLAVSVTLNGATNATLSVGGVAEDTLRNVENIVGGSAGDTLVGDTAANFLDGAAGDDILTGGIGVDVLEGGLGSDTASFAEKTVAVTVNLNQAFGVIAKVNGVDEDLLRNIENLTGGTGADVFIGNSLANTLDGGNGNDTLRGGAGNDVLDGGAGTDTADYTDMLVAVSVTLNGATNATASVNGVAQDTLRNIENVIGGIGNDVFTGDTLANKLEGGTGNDILKGAGGNDDLDGGIGIDTADYSDKATVVSVTLNGATNATVTVGGVAEDTVRNIENVTGGSAADTITGDSAANTLSGGLGNDVMIGSFGDDILIGGEGNDTLNGGTNSDTASYADKVVAVSVTLNGAVGATVTVGGIAEDTVLNVENIIGSSVVDTLTGDALANTFSGRGGNDILDGAGGLDTADYAEKTAAIVVTLNGASAVAVSVGGKSEDSIVNIENIIGGSAADTLTGDSLANVLNGGGGNDILRGGTGIDTLDGGANGDTVLFSDLSQAVVLTLNGATLAQATVGGVADDFVVNVENITGGTGNDILTGDGGFNILNGGEGNDVLAGMGGQDTLDGGAGIDTGSFAATTSAVQVTLNGSGIVIARVGGIVEDTLRNIENVIGGTAGDTITGDSLANTISGRAGNDTLDGAGGIDTADYAEKTSSVVATLNGSTLASVTVGGVAEDNIRNFENIIGGSADDTLTGDAQINIIEGGNGNDVLAGLAEDDILDGGAGSDTASYAEKTETVDVTLNGATDALVSVNAVGEDLLRNIENVIGGSAADTLTGDSQDNTFRGGLGNDILDGAAGSDTADYSDKAAAVVVTLNTATNVSVTVGGVAEDTIRNIENVIGGSAADTLTGDSAANALSGGGSNDTLRGNGGIDAIDGGGGSGDTVDFGDKATAVVLTLNGSTLATATVGGVSEDTVRNVENVIGGTGDDTLTGDSAANTLSGGNGNDTLQGADGIDTIDGGTGTSDTADFSDKSASVVLTLNGATDATATVGGVAEDTVRNIENITGGAGDDTLVGDGQVNILAGGSGNDTLQGLAGNDTLDGGADSDTADYSEKAAAVVVTLNTATNATVTVGGVTEDTIRNIENVIGGSAADTLTGDSAANALTGGGSDDSLRGNGGNDTIDGGAGTGDTVDFGDKTTSVVLTLNGATNATATVGGVAEDTVRNVERVIGGSGDDTIDGDSAANVLSGGLGNDMLQGAGGNDTIDGGGGTSDTADFSDKTTSVLLTLNGATDATATIGGVAEDTVRNVENVIGGTGDDSLVGDSQANTLSGGNGNDTLVGLAGNDTLDGGAGTDIADYSEKAAAVVVTLNTSTNASVTIGGVAEDTIRNIETVLGGSAADTLTGDTANNFFRGAAGNDVLDGGAGTDVASYSEKTASVVVTLNTSTNATVTVGGVAEDTVRNIENITGGSGNDTLVGDTAVNVLDGGLGDDSLRGAAGNDTLDGGAGTDIGDYSDKTTAVVVTLNTFSNTTVTVGGVAEDTIRNIETLIGGTAGDTFTGDTASNLFRGRAGNDVLDGGAGTDTADYSDKTTAVVVTLNTATNASVTVGGVAEDTVRNIENLIGGTAADTFTGDTASNVLRGGAGNDVLDGGAGTDTADYSDKTTSVVVTLNTSTNATVTVGGVAEDTVRNIENVTGGTGNDTLTGDTAANTLDGGLGNDTLSGAGGADVFLLTGGNDSVSGGAAMDQFLFSAGALGTAVTSTVSITDFDRALLEVLDLSAIDAIAATGTNDAFTFVGSAAFSGLAGELRWTDQGATQLIQGDVNGDSVADLTIVATAAGPVTSSWFTL